MGIEWPGRTRLERRGRFWSVHGIDIHFEQIAVTTVFIWRQHTFHGNVRSLRGGSPSRRGGSAGCLTGAGDNSARICFSLSMVWSKPAPEFNFALIAVFGVSNIL